MNFFSILFSCSRSVEMFTLIDTDTQSLLHDAIIPILHNLAPSSVIVSYSYAISRGFVPWPGHTKNHHKNGANCLPAWHACVRVGV